MYFKYLDYPPIPDEFLLNDIREFDNLTNIFHIPSYAYYKQYHITDIRLINFLQSIFSFPFFASYQIISNGIAIHKDVGRSETINYLIDTGGENATLSLFDNNKLLIHSEIVKARKWHWIDVSTYHNVSNFVSPRIAISIVPNDKFIQSN